jgi:hypothetical protein
VIVPSFVSVNKSPPLTAIASFPVDPVTCPALSIVLNCAALEMLPLTMPAARLVSVRDVWGFPAARIATTFAADVIVPELVSVCVPGPKSIVGVRPDTMMDPEFSMVSEVPWLSITPLMMPSLWMRLFAPYTRIA